MTTEQIVKALREVYNETDKVYFFLRTIVADAADLIETQAAEIDRLTAENARLDEELGRCTSGNGCL